MSSFLREPNKPARLEIAQRVAENMIITAQQQNHSHGELLKIYF